MSEPQQEKNTDAKSREELWEKKKKKRHILALKLCNHETMKMSHHRNSPPFCEVCFSLCAS